MASTWTTLKNVNTDWKFWWQRVWYNHNVINGYYPNAPQLFCLIHHNQINGYYPEHRSCSLQQSADSCSDCSPVCLIIARFDCSMHTLIFFNNIIIPSLLPQPYVVRREGNFFTRVSLSVHKGGIVQSQVLSPVSGSRSIPRGTPVPEQGGVVSGGQGTPMETTERVLATQRAVCLLRSRRRTFLFPIKLK